MARLPAPSRRGPLVRIAYAVSKRIARRKTGVRPDDALAPLKVVANNPKVMLGFGGFEHALDRSRTLPPRLAILARDGVSPLVGCLW